MSWNLLAYVYPLRDFAKALAYYEPSLYAEYEKAPESSYSSAVKACIHRVLETENKQGTVYFEAIQ